MTPAGVITPVCRVTFPVPPDQKLSLGAPQGKYRATPRACRATSGRRAAALGVIHNSRIGHVACSVYDSHT